MKRKENTLFVEKYRPTNMDTYIADDKTKQMFKEYIEKKEIPNLLLHGTPGCGKTTIAKIFAESISPNSYLYVNASDENTVGFVREQIMNFISTVSFNGELKIIILDEADFLSASAQAALKATTEQFSDTVRFIFTCNNPEKIIDALQSRCHSYLLGSPSKKEIAKLVLDILNTEKIQYEKTDVGNIIISFYPDIRKIIHCTQQYIINGKLVIDDDIINQHNYINNVIEILSDRKKKSREKITEIRTVFANNYIREYSFLYRSLYDNMDKYVSGDKTVEVICLISEAQYKDRIVKDKEINAAALIYSIANIIDRKVI
ncbi:HolB ATPase [Microcystis phage Mel-JY01]